MKAPFIWFGGKRRVAEVVWEALGDVDNYVEPFAGSLAVLLARPEWHCGTTETVSDADRFLSNFWRALAAAPDEVARYADWPVNEADLFARHLWLVNEGAILLGQNIEADPDWYDAKVAGWWVWGLNCWIGSGWCAGDGPWTREATAGISQLPHLGSPGQGVNRQLPHLGNPGQGVNRQRPHLGNPGDDSGYHRVLPQNEALLAYFAELARRLRRVRVCCGDWSRVVTEGALAYGATVGVFLDPPYSGDVRTNDLYAADDHQVSAEVREWALSRGQDHRYRIVLAGYEPEHREAMARAGWRMHAYSASAAYQTARQAGGGRGNQANRHLERLWFSPHCLTQRQAPLFEGP